MAKPESERREKAEEWDLNVSITQSPSSPCTEISPLSLRFGNQFVVLVGPLLFTVGKPGAPLPRGVVIHL